MIEEISEPSEKEKTFRTIEGCELEISGPSSLIVFGGAGDLAKRKLIPSIYRLYKHGLLSKDFFLLSADRIEIDADKYRSMIGEAAKSAFPEDFDDPSWTDFASKLYFVSLDFSQMDSYAAILKERLPSLETKHGTGGNRIFYLAVPPFVFEDVINNLGRAGLAQEDGAYTHIVIEKPFGHDLNSAKRLNNVLKQYFKERQIFRIDHYVAKEPVQNMLMFRFANSIFEPLWNRRYVDHVQITCSETIGVGHRAAYYEKAGVIRDMFQSHILQILAVTAMEPPVAFNADRVMDEKIKIFRSIRPFSPEKMHDSVVIGQYGRGTIDGESVVAYREEPGIAPESATPTFAAMKVFIDNWRWHGVPFYLRSGKRMTTRNTEISIHFKPVPYSMFRRVMEEVIEPNILCFTIQPDEGIRLAFQTKRTGSRICLETVLMDFTYRKGILLDAYQWVLLDCMLGDQMLFLRQEGVEETWSLLTPVMNFLEAETRPEKFPNYDAGSSGPAEADDLIKKDGRDWMPLETSSSDESSDIPRFRGGQSKSR
ncbi:MAG: glucose-6-phosphate dehydrogenase [Nitrospirota bacterium]